MRRAVIALLVLALSLRVGAVAAGDFTATGDPADYVRHAQSIAAGDGYPPSDVASGETAIRPPVYPYLLGGVFALTGDSVTAGRLVNAVIGTVAVALIGLLGAALWGPRGGVAALAAGAVFPPLIVVGNAPLSEPSFLVLALGAVLAALRSARGTRRRWVAAAGALAGLAILTRANGAILLLPLVLAVWGARPRLVAPALLLACAALVVAPWTVRNAVVLDTFVAVSTSAPYTLAGTYNETTRTDPDYPGAWRLASADPAMAALLRRTEGLSEVARGRELREVVREHIGDHPAYPLEVAARNLARYAHLDGADLYRESARSEGLTARQADFAALGLLAGALLALAGLALGALRGTPRWVWLVPVVLLLSAAPFVTATRFRAPADPFVVLLAGYGALAVAARLRRA